MITLFYYKYSANIFLKRSGFKFWRSNAELQFFDKGKQAWQLIISPAKAFGSVLSTFSRYYNAWSTKIW